MFTNLLGLLMLSVGVTTTVDDFKACFDRLGTVALNLALCYGGMLEGLGVLRGWRGLPLRASGMVPHRGALLSGSVTEEVMEG